MRSLSVGCALVVAVLSACSAEPVFDGRKASEWISLMRHDDWAIREGASDTLARNAEAALPYLKKGLTSRDPAVATWVARTVGKIGPLAKPLVPIMLSRVSLEEVPGIRQALLDALQQVAPLDEPVQAEFTKRLRDVDPDVRASAQRGLDLAKPAPPPEVAQVPPREETLELRAAIATVLEAMRPGTTFAEVAEIVRGERRAAILWPAKGAVLEGAPIALVFEKKPLGKDWEKIGEIGSLRESGAPLRLSEALGGTDAQRVVRSCGVERDQIGSFVETHGTALEQHLLKGELPEAMAAFEQLSRAFAFSALAYGSLFSELQNGKAFTAPWTLDSGTAERVPVKLTLKGQPVERMLEFQACGTGVVIAGLREKSAP